MSPKQARGEGIDKRSDLFSLGSVMYAMCTGHPPFRAETAYGILRRITDNAPRPIREVNSDIPDWLCGIIDRLRQKDANHRFETADDVAQLLSECLAHVQNPTTTLLPANLQRARSLGKAIRTILYLTPIYVALIAIWLFTSAQESSDNANATNDVVSNVEQILVPASEPTLTAEQPSPLLDSISELPDAQSHDDAG